MWFLVVLVLAAIGLGTLGFRLGKRLAALRRSR